MVDIGTVSMSHALVIKAKTATSNAFVVFEWMRCLWIGVIGEAKLPLTAKNNNEAIVRIYSHSSRGSTNSLLGVPQNPKDLVPQALIFNHLVLINRVPQRTNWADRDQFYGREI
jgi:hypothetical protein